MKLVGSLTLLLLITSSLSMHPSLADQHIGDQFTYEIQNFKNNKLIKKDQITLEITAIDTDHDKIIATTVNQADKSAKGSPVEFKLSDVNTVELLYTNCLQNPDEAKKKGYKTGSADFTVNDQKVDACLLSKNKNHTREDLWASPVPFGIVKQILITGSNKEVTTLKNFKLRH